MLVAAGLGWVAFRANQPAVDPIAARIAADSGLEPATYDRLMKIMGAAGAGQPVASEDFAFVVRMTRHERAEMRTTAFDTLGAFEETPWRDQAIESVAAMRDDADPGIRADYPYRLMLLNAKNWREVAAAQSPDPETRERARTTLELGEKKWGRKP